jgi:hypothetical protein
MSPCTFSYFLSSLYHMAKNMLASRVSSPFRLPSATTTTGTYTSSLRRGNSLTDDDPSRFSTRTRLRPGGPAPRSRSTATRPRYSSTDPQAVYGTPTARRTFSEVEAEGAWQLTGGCATPLVLARSRPAPRSTVVYAHARQGRSCIEEASV